MAVLMAQSAVETAPAAPDNAETANDKENVPEETPGHFVAFSGKCGMIRLY